jgi:acyl dehydratase
VSAELIKSATQLAMNRWGDLSDDHNPIHCEPEYAAATRYRGTILHGHMSIAWMMEWAMTAWGEAWLHRGELVDVRFRKALEPDTAYTIHADPVSSADDEVSLSVRLPDGTPGITATARLRSTT